MLSCTLCSCEKFSMENIPGGGKIVGESCTRCFGYTDDTFGASDLMQGK